MCVNENVSVVVAEYHMAVQREVQDGMKRKTLQLHNDWEWSEVGHHAVEWRTQTELTTTD